MACCAPNDPITIKPLSTHRPSSASPRAKQVSVCTMFESVPACVAQTNTNPKNDTIHNMLRSFQQQRDHPRQSDSSNREVVTTLCRSFAYKLGRPRNPYCFATPYLLNGTESAQAGPIVVIGQTERSCRATQVRIPLGWPRETRVSVVATFLSAFLIWLLHLFHRKKKSTDFAQIW